MSRKHFCLQLNSFFRETGTCPGVSLLHRIIPTCLIRIPMFYQTRISKIAYYFIKTTIFAARFGTTVKRYCLVMFNRVAQREFATAHNITGKNLPRRQYEITCLWNLGGDGKCFWGWAPEEEWFQKEMRK